MPANIKITFTGGSLLGEERVLSLAEPAVLGRTHSASLRVKEPDVSARHMEFRIEADGVYAHCLSRNGFSLNGEKVPEGESRRIGVDDVLLLGSRVRFRIDGISGETAPSDAEESATFATRAPNPDETATLATQFASQGELHASQDETFATMAVDAEDIPAPPADEMRGSVEETPLGDADSTAGAAPSRDNSPTLDEGAARPAEDASNDFGFPDDSSDEQATGSDSGISDGETVEMKTRKASMDEIFRMKRMLEAKKRYRRKLVAFVALLFFVMLGTFLFVNWPREERHLQHPLKAGTKELDISQYVVKSETGDIEMVVDYPNAPDMTKKESESGLDVSTFTGRKRNVPFRLSFLRRADPAQLRMSLADCAAAEIKSFEGRGYVFYDGVGDANLGTGVRGDFLFFEREHPASCQVRIQAGTKFFRGEYIYEEGGVKWHGVMILLRSGIRVYRLMREIPDDAWFRGKSLLLADPNIALYMSFMVDRWESPGKEGILPDADFDGLCASVREDLDRERPDDWPRIKMKIDTLMVQSFSGSETRRNAARALLSRFSKIKSKFYNEFKTRYDIGVAESNYNKRRAAFEACRGAFGRDSSDLRSIRINDPEEWSCQSKQY